MRVRKLDVCEQGNLNRMFYWLFINLFCLVYLILDKYIV